MLDCARVLIERNKHITGSAIFLFNGAEGMSTALSGLKLSHLFALLQKHCKMPLISTQHNTRPRICESPSIAPSMDSTERLQASRW
jgi:hypothetical protein